MRSLSCFLVAGALAACSSGETSIALRFPNAEARTAIQRITVEAHTPDTGAASANDRDCGDFLDKAREGKSPLGTPVRGGYDYPFTADQELPKVPSGRQIIYVLAFATREDDAPAILEGCTDKFDSKGGSEEHVDVLVELKLVIPESARLVKVAGDRQVGREGEQLAVPLQVRAEADSPTGSGPYVIPGVDVVFTSMDEGFEMIGAASGMLALHTNTEGEAQVDVKLPDTAKTGEVVATAEQLDGPMSNDTDRWKQTFSLSVTERISFPTSALIDGSDLPIAVALGNIGGGSSLDLAVLSCSGPAEGCLRGGEARGQLGQTKLTVIEDVGRSPQPVTVVEPAGGLGITPAALVVADLVKETVPTDDIAILNSRRAECQNRVCRDASCACYGTPIGGACPCEGSEVLVFKSGAGQVVLDHRATLTASNAVGMTSFVSESGMYRNLAIAAQGRSKNTRPCSRINRCLPSDAPQCATNPEECGCPAGERCDCTDCAQSMEPGLCVARDKMIDLLINRWNVTPAQPNCSATQPTGRCPTENEICQAGRCVQRTMFNRGGCQQAEVTCNNNSAMGDCECVDEFRQNTCEAVDACGCAVPDKILIGDVDAPIIPNGLISGPLKSAANWDIVMPLDSGLGLVEARPSQKTFAFKDQPIINARMHAAEVVSLDSEVDQVPDVVWMARGACTRGVNFDRACPLFRNAPEGTTPLGCVGVYYTDNQASVFELRTPQLGGCRRYLVPYEPDGMCLGKFNDDSYLDVAIASHNVGYVAVFAGDGRGGLLDPPEEIALPPNGVGGPIACGDIDGDRKDDLVITNQMSGDIYVLRTGS